MEFQKYLPSKATQPIVVYYWTLRSNVVQEAGAHFRFIPDGYVDWIFHLKAPWSYTIPSTNCEPLSCRAHVFAQVKTHIDLVLPKEELFLFGVKFYPWASRQIWKIDLGECTDKCLSLFDLGIKGASFLWEQIHTANTVAARIGIVEAFLLKGIMPQKLCSLAPLIQQMERAPTVLPEPITGIKKRRLEQRFKAEVGISPKLMQRTIRINKIIHRLIQQPETRLTDLAYEFDFFDQSHFIADFKKFTGCSPKQFLRSIAPDGDIYNFRPNRIQG